MRRKMGLMGVLGMLALPFSAMAMDGGMAKSAKVGLEYRGELTYDDHGTEKVSADAATSTAEVDPSKTTEIELRVVKLRFDFDLAPMTTFHTRIMWAKEAADLSEKTQGHKHGLHAIPEYAYLSHRMNDMLAFDVGLQRVLQNGFWQANYEYDTILELHTKDHFAMFEPGIAVHFDTVGRVSLQFLNDVSDCTVYSVDTNSEIGRAHV